MTLPSEEHPLGSDDTCHQCDGPLTIKGHHLHWVICGGESGAGSRPMHPDWARGLRDQCQAAGVPFFFKQWGEWEPQMQATSNTGFGRAIHVWDEPEFANSDCKRSFRVGKKAAGHLLDGKEHHEFPSAK